MNSARQVRGFLCRYKADRMIARSEVALLMSVIFCCADFSEEGVRHDVANLKQSKIYEDEEL